MQCLLHAVESQPVLRDGRVCDNLCFKLISRDSSACSQVGSILHGAVGTALCALAGEARHHCSSHPPLSFCWHTLVHTHTGSAGHCCEARRGGRPARHTLATAAPRRARARPAVLAVPLPRLCRPDRAGGCALGGGSPGAAASGGWAPGGGAVWPQPQRHPAHHSGREAGSRGTGELGRSQSLAGSLSLHRFF